MNNREPNFMDSRTLMAVILVAVLFVGWQAYLKNKYGTAPAPAAPTAAGSAQTPAAPGAEAPAAATTPAPEAQKAAPAAAATTSSPEKTLKYENAALSFELTSKGMGLKNMVLKDHKDRDLQPMKLGVSEKASLYQMTLANNLEALDFEITQKSENEFQGVAQVGATQVIRNMRINPDTQAIENTVQISNIDTMFPGVAVTIPEKTFEGAGSSLLAPSMEFQEFIVLHSGKEERTMVTGAKPEDLKKIQPASSMVGVSTHFFTSVMVDKSEIIPEAHLEGGEKEIKAQFLYKPVLGKNTMDLKWIAYSGGKSASTLEKIDPEMTKVINFGFFSTIARALLRTLVWLHSVFGNWGVAIILLTLMVRILVLPLNVSTFKSTKKMQKLQPIMTSLRERYKDDPQALNREMMNVWKEHKVNPMGGCLPMLLQLPIFFALYQVLGQSIELYQAPFILWIKDLSLKDPYYVLPVLMGICMYIQQKITPTTMDPTQAKVMQILPVVFALMMVSLPSGLTLYIFINTLAGIILQQLFMRDGSTAVKAKEAKA